MADTALRAIAYGDHPRLLLDVHRPEGAGKAPVVVFFHGGGWRSCARDDVFHGPIGPTLARAGLLVVLPDYRLYPDACFPAFIDDAARAVAWARANAETFGGDPRRLVLAGYSAGAHIATLLAYAPCHLESCGLARGVVSGVAGLSGYYDFTADDDPFVSRVFPPDLLAHAAQPARHADAGAPPSLLVHGLKDGIVRPEQTDRLEAALLAAGAPVRTMRLPDDDHHSYLQSMHTAPERTGVLAALAELARTGALPSSVPDLSKGTCQ
ncbi:alpha/beta hydrolase [Azospirillum sp. Sh1]|uniref:alpha/beta hydrolase n=1 Tax=Azospirillum sp. Sh1 TaxID=2607285 RepID=UPI00165DBF1A|nr:alpha/beta hydrolase [Azospirillum sp. Sh1]